MSRLRLALNGIRTNKLKFFLVYVSVMLTVMILIVSNSFEKSMIQTRLEQLREETMNSQILIYSEEEELKLFDYDKVMSEIGKNTNVKYVVPRASVSAMTELNSQFVYIYGLDLEKQKEVYELSLSTGESAFTEENGVIVSETFVKNNKLKLNETFIVTTEAGTFEFVIKGIAPDAGFFSWDYNTIICSLSMGQKLVGTTYQINRLDVTLKSLDQIEETRDELNVILKQYHLSAEEKYSADYYDSFVSTIVLALNLFIMFTALISIYIIYSVFRSYVYENIDEMATLRSIGFSIKEYRSIVFSQIIMIVSVASICGILISYPCMKGMLFFFTKYNGDVAYSAISIVVIILAIYMIAIVSGWLAIRKIIKTPITQLIRKSNLLVSSTGKKVIGFFGVLFIAGSIVFFLFIENDIGVLAYYISAVFAIIGFILLQGFFVRIYTFIIFKLFQKKGKGIGFITKELKYNSSSYIQSITITSMVLVIATLTLSVSFILKTALGSVYKGADLVVNVYSEEYETAKDALENHDNIDSYTMQKRKYITVENNNVILSGIDIEAYIKQDYERVIHESREEVFGKLKSDNTVIITTNFSKKIKKEVGDCILIEEQLFEIVGKVSSFENMGSLLFISRENYEKMWDDYDVCLGLITTSKDKLEVVKADLEEQYTDFKAYGILQTSVLFEENLKQNQLIINMIYMLCIFSLLISGISLVSNLIINMLSRIRSFLIYRTVGVEKKQIVKMEISEALLMGIYSGIVGIGMGCVLLPVVSNILSYYVGDLPVRVEPYPLLVLLASICILIVLSMLYVVNKYILHKNLMEEAKRYY